MVQTQPRKIVKVARKLADAAPAKTQPTRKTRAATLPPVKAEVKSDTRGDSLIGKKRQPAEKIQEIQPSPKARKAKKVSVDDRKDVKAEVKTESEYRSSSQPAKPKKTVKKPTEFKVGRWNPNTEIVEKEIEKLDDSDDVQFKCCLKCNARNVMRAILTNNKFLLRRVMHDHKHIPSLDLPWSTQCPMRPLQIIANQSNIEMM